METEKNIENTKKAYDFKSKSKNVYAFGYYEDEIDDDTQFDEEPNQTFVEVGSYNANTDIIKFYNASENLLLNQFLLSAIKLLKEEKPQGLGL